MLKNSVYVNIFFYASIIALYAYIPTCQTSSENHYEIRIYSGSSRRVKHF